MKDHRTIEGQGGTFSAYIARPKTSPAPAVVVLQELFGVNADIRNHCNELAEQGFLALEDLQFQGLLFEAAAAGDEFNAGALQGLTDALQRL